MGRSGEDLAPPPRIVGNRKLMRSLGLILCIGAPFWVESAWIVASWWRPILGIGPLPGFKTPCLTFLKSLTGLGSSKAGDVWGDMRSSIFSNPSQGVAVFLFVATGCVLLMRRSAGR